MEEVDPALPSSQLMRGKKSATLISERLLLATAFAEQMLLARLASCGLRSAVMSLVATFFSNFSALSSTVDLCTSHGDEQRTK